MGYTVNIVSTGGIKSILAVVHKQTAGTNDGSFLRRTVFAQTFPGFCLGIENMQVIKPSPAAFAPKNVKVLSDNATALFFG